jgi:hypothetical protein
MSKQFNRTVNYISTIGYLNEDSSMSYHQHGEDHGHDTPVWIVSTGAARTWGLREKDKPETEIRFQVEPGSLLILPNSYNYTHEHAVLKDKTPRAMRIAPNMKALDDIYFPDGVPKAVGGHFPGEVKDYKPKPTKTSPLLDAVAADAQQAAIV